MRAIGMECLMEYTCSSILETGHLIFSAERLRGIILSVATERSYF